MTVFDPSPNKSNKPLDIPPQLRILKPAPKTLKTFLYTHKTTAEVAQVFQRQRDISRMFLTNKWVPLKRKLALKSFAQGVERLDNLKNLRKTPRRNCQ